MKINQTEIWSNLVQEQKELMDFSIEELMQDTVRRQKSYIIQAADIQLDMRRHYLTDHTLELFTQLANTAELVHWREKLFSGEKLNHTEQRAVLHTALRQAHLELNTHDQSVTDLVQQELKKIQHFCEAIQQGKWRGATGEMITDVVNIGIGGSDLGPRLVVEALSAIKKTALNCHFVANIDPANLQEVLNKIDPAKTLFVISSKSFGTEETLSNALAAKQWMQKQLQLDYIQQHFVAVTANREKAEAFGISPHHIFSFWDWVGGRFSIWSAIGLPIALTIGFSNFLEFLAGAKAMDQHFCSAPFSENMPVMLAMLGIWYRNFFQTQSHAILTYSYRMRHLSSYLQQLEMESNGKRVNRHGEKIEYATAPVIWGGEGTNGQHAYHQLLHQGTDLIPIDIILLKQQKTAWPHMQRSLYIHGLAQAQAFVKGQHGVESHREIPGNKPCTLLELEELTPYRLGALLALYEHKVFVQGVIWQINSFDQWGVELGKIIAQKMFQDA